jgi:transketolase
MRRNILEAAFKAGEGHIASAYSILEIVESVYTCMTYMDGHPNSFILSKGHASLALYAVLENHGLISDDWVNDFCKFDSNFGGHPDSLKIPQVLISSGSLGHGLPFAVGMALANKACELLGRVTVLVGDGELNEGSNWESLLVASHHKLNNLQIIVDFNHSGDRAIDLGDLESKFSSFGCQVIEVDGHDVESISESLLRECSDVKVVIARTIKGFGIKTMQGNPEWHHKAPNQEQFEVFNEELT